jgi:hypothetical protein
MLKIKSIHYLESNIKLIVIKLKIIKKNGLDFFELLSLYFMK